MTSYSLVIFVVRILFVFYNQRAKLSQKYIVNKQMELIKK